MGYFKEKDIEQKELLERAMKIVKDVDDSSWMIYEIIHGFQGRDGLTHDTALITLGRLYERMDAIKTKAPQLLIDHREFEKSTRTEVKIDIERSLNLVKAPHGFGRYMAQHESNHAPLYCDKPSGDWDKFINRIKINTDKYNRPPHLDLDEFGIPKPLLDDEPKKSTPEPKKRGRPSKKKIEVKK